MQVTLQIHGNSVTYNVEKANVCTSPPYAIVDGTDRARGSIGLQQRGYIYDG